MKATHTYTTGEKVSMMMVQMTVTLDLIAYCMLEAAELLEGRIGGFDVNGVEDMVISQLQSDGDIHYMYKLHEKYKADEIRNARRVALRLFPTFKKDDDGASS